MKRMMREDPVLNRQATGDLKEALENNTDISLRLVKMFIHQQVQSWSNKNHPKLHCTKMLPFFRIFPMVGPHPDAVVEPGADGEVWTREDFDIVKRSIQEHTTSLQKMSGACQSENLNPATNNGNSNAKANTKSTRKSCSVYSA
jgi:hypothetical protein